MKRTALACSLCLLFAAATGRAAPLDVLTDENPPFNFQDGKTVDGAATEILREAAKRAEIPLNITLGNRDEAYSTTQAATDTCMYSVARKPDNELLFKWVGPLINNKWAVYSRQDFNDVVKSTSDMKKYKVAAETFDGRIDYLRQNGFIGIIEDDNDVHNATRVFLKKDDPNYADLWLTGVYGAKKRATAAKVPDMKMVYTLRDIPLYLACSTQTAKATVDKLTAALEAMKKDGTLAKMQQKLSAQ